MSAQANAPVIIKKVKKVSGEGHHGGAWKVAYADFVTAMMAFFMLMWLLNATTEKQRKGIADYFSPTIPVNRVSGGGQDAFGGDSVFSEESLAQTGQGGLPSHADAASAEAPDGGISEAEATAEAQALEELEEKLTGKSGESMVSDQLQRHIVTELTDEGLLIELFDIADEPLFVAGTDRPTAILEELVEVMAQVFGYVRNGVAIEGHTRAEPVVLANNTVWELSQARADRVRIMLADGGLSPVRVQRVTGHADRQSVARNPMALRNNRIELILLRTKR